jgi:hypothetical protein
MPKLSHDKFLLFCGNHVCVLKKTARMKLDLQNLSNLEQQGINTILNQLLSHYFPLSPQNVCEVVEL